MDATVGTLRPGRLVEVIVAVLLAAAVYEGLVAAGAIDLGSQPGEGPAGGRIVLVVALLAMVCGALAAVLVAERDGRPSFGALLAPAAAAFLVARFYTFDPYYLPTLRRLSDAGLLPAWLIYLAVAFALLAGVLAWVRPRIGLWPTAAAMLACGFFAWVAAAGH